MVSLRIYGRTGNQCIMVSCALAYSLKHNIEYHIPAHTVNDEVWPPAFTNLENPNYNSNLETIHIKENGRGYFELPFEESWRNKNIELDGYWQSYPYFNDYKTEILKTLGFTDYPWGYGPDHRTYCNIHWRIGDFKLYPTKHPIVTEEYMKKAIDEIVNRTAIRRFGVGSDNIDECKGFFKRFTNWPYQSEFTFEHPTVFTPLEHIIHDSRSAAHIISNSTFSWFSAWANTYKYKTVICPHEDNWYGIDNRHIDVSMLLPKDWIRIKY